MERQAVPLDKLCLPAFGAWDPGWLLLTAGENRPGGFNSMTVSWGALGVLWGRPLASDGLLSKLESRLGRCLRPLPVGRPRKPRTRPPTRRRKEK